MLSCSLGVPGSPFAKQETSAHMKHVMLPAYLMSEIYKHIYTFPSVHI